MKPIKSILFSLIILSTTASAQLMNVRKWRISERDSLDKGMELFDEKTYLKALPIFGALLNNHPKEEFLKYTYAKCALYRADKHEESYKNFLEVYDNNKKVPDIQYDMALISHYNYKFDEALEYANLHSKRSNLEGKANAEALKKNIAYAKYYLANPTNAKVTNVGPAINSEYDEYSPSIKADESAMIFTYAGAKSIGGRQNETLQPDRYGFFMEDIYMSLRQNGEFKQAFGLDSLNTNASDAAISLSNDGTTLFIFKDEGDGHGDIYQSFLSGEHFTKPQKLKGEVNSYSWDGHCSLSPDGQTLYFSSERAGGFGGRDIYRARLLADSSWGNVVNLGDSINTPLDDDAPFIHADGITLYYSSKGRTSMGGYDVFRSVMKTEDSTFKKTENLGYPINSPADDIYFVLGANGTTGYYSSGKKDGMGMKDIYRVEPNFVAVKPVLYLVKGNVKSGNNGVEATIKVEITSKNNRLYNTFKSNSITGEYLITLPPGVNYLLTYSYKSSPEQRLNIEAVDLSTYTEKIFDASFEVPVVSTPTDVLASVEVKKSEVAETKAKPEQTVATVSEVKTETKTEEPVAASAKANETATVKQPETVPVTDAKPEPVAVVEKNNNTTNTSAKTTSEKTEAVPTAASVAIKNPFEARPSGTTSATWDFTTNPVTSTPLALPAKTASKTSFVAVNGPQAKSMRFAEKYEKVTADDMEFRVQVAAVKNDKNVALPNQKILGKVEKLNLGDGFIRITVGGAFKTLGEALEHNKKVVKAGQKEGFIISLYKGKRVTYEELEQMGLLK